MLSALTSLVLDASQAVNCSLNKSLSNFGHRRKATHIEEEAKQILANVSLNVPKPSVGASENEKQIARLKTVSDKLIKKLKNKAFQADKNKLDNKSSMLGGGVVGTTQQKAVMDSKVEHKTIAVEKNYATR